MSQIPHSLKINQIDGNESDLNQPQIALLQDHHWLYVKNRYRMTTRELQIAKFVCQGLSNEKIAQKLNIKHGTVKTHIRNIYRKIWVNNKISMFLRFIEDASNLSHITIGSR